MKITNLNTKKTIELPTRISKYLHQEWSEESKFQTKANDMLKELGIEYHHIEKGRHHKNNHCGDILDLIIWGEYPKHFFIELKAKSKNYRTGQKDFVAKMTKLGYKCYLAYTLDKILTCLWDMGLITIDLFDNDKSVALSY
jgi:hypothetical protein